MGYDYDMAVIGGGSAGLTAAGISASFGAKTALVEAKRLGGDCTWYGCVPSKTLIKAAKVAHHIRNADRYGLNASQPDFQFAEVMEHVHTIQSHIYHEADAPPVYEEMGIDVIIARAKFLDSHTIELVEEGGNTSQLSSRYFIISTGSTPFIPPIEGLSTVDYLTNETIFSLSELPGKLIVIGPGPIGIEMSQAFRRFGSEVSVIGSSGEILKKDDKELTDILKQTLISEGVQFVLNAKTKKVERSDGHTRLIIEIPSSPGEVTIEGDALLVSAGRRATIQGLDLEAAGVEVDKRGIVVNDHCRTSVRNIFACGDVAGRYQFTHFAEHMAKVAVSSAILHMPSSLDSKHIVWCTYTDPELAHVGASEDELKERGVSYGIYRFPFSKVDRAITDSETTGMIKVLAKNLNGKIYGVSILGANAGEMIGEYAIAMRKGVTLRSISDTIHPYPTYVLGNRRAADQWYVRKQSRAMVRWLQRIFRYHGQLPDTSNLEERIV